MNDIRILIPWNRLPHELTDRYVQTEFEKYCTRPITPEDIRSCLRMPEDWTDEQIDEFKDYIMEWTTSHLHSNSVAGRALEIATRPAPAHKPCPFCGGSTEIKYYDYDDTLKWLECTKCNRHTASEWIIDEDLDAWDRRAEEKDPSVAPKLDPWEEMDRFVKDTDGWGDTRLSMIWAELKKAEGK